MFNRPGHKLKIIAIVIFFFFTLLGVAAGYVLTANFGQQYMLQSQAETFLFGEQSRLAATLTVIICGLIGMVVGWLNSIMLYAIGSLVDDVEEIKNRMK